MVFAHYMLCCPLSGSGAAVEDFKHEIRVARAHGVDGFALNAGGWDVREPHYKARAIAMYEAARQLGTDFKLFISVDFATHNTPGEFRDAIRSFRDHPNQLRQNGKPVISTFGGTRFAADLIATARTEAAFFVPFFYPTPATELPNAGHIDRLIVDYAELDGYFFFGAAGLPSQLAAAQRLHATKWRRVGKTFMASVTPYYAGHGRNARLFDTRGFSGMAAVWQSAIEADADWIQIVTWNDPNESSYVALGGPLQSTAPLWQQAPHLAYLLASRYFIEWFKSGKKPEITSDQLFYFHRLEPVVFDFGQALRLTGTRGASDLRDDVYVTAFLRAPATLSIQTAAGVKRQELSAGVHHVAAPLGSGAPRFILSRGNTSVIDRVSEATMQDRGGVTRFNYHAGSAP
jgi:hypothetical protein